MQFGLSAPDTLPTRLQLSLTLMGLELEPDLASALARAPSVQMQRTLLVLLLRKLEPLLQRHGLTMPFRYEPGLRLRRRYGLCRFDVEGQPLIQVRCTRDGDRGHWRRPSAIMGTLIHELSHLRHHRHSAAFWRLCRALLNEAAMRGLYSGEADDPAERPQGRGRLAGSAADAVVSAARTRRREHARAARELVSTWSIGAWARLRDGNGGISRQVVSVLGKRRTRLVVQSASGRRYLVNANMLEPLGSSQGELVRATAR